MVSRLEFSETSLTIEGAKSEGASGTLTATNTSGSAVSLTFSGEDSDKFRVSPTEVPAGESGLTLTVTCPAATAAASYSATLKSAASSAFTADDELTVSATILEDVTFSAAGVDITQPVGTENTGKVTVKNNRTATVTLALSGSNAGSFSLPSTPVDSGASKEVTITCTAAAAGSYDATLKASLGGTDLTPTLPIHGSVIDEAAVEGALNIKVGADAADSSGAPADAEDSTSISASGNLQRLWLGVPSRKTELSLGANVHGYHHGGVSVATGEDSATSTNVGHIWLQAQGGQAAKGTSATDDEKVAAAKQSTITLQAKANTILQSYGDSTYLFPNGDATFVSEGKSFVLSPGSISVIAGPPNFWNELNRANTIPANDKPTDDDPTDMSPAAGIAKAAGEIKSVWLPVNIVVGVLTIAVSLVAAYEVRATKTQTVNKDWLNATWVPLLNCTRIAALSIAGASGALKEGSLSVYAASGIVAGTPGFVAVHGLLGVAYRSLNITQFALTSVALKGLLGTVGLQSIKSVSASSAKLSVTIEGEEEVQLNAKKGDLILEAPEVEVGGAFLGGHHAPTTTSTIKAEALNNVELTAPKISLESRSLVQMQGATGVDLTAGANLEIVVGDAYSVVLSATGGITCGATKGPGPKLEVTPLEVKLVGPDGVELSLGPSGITFGSSVVNLNVNAGGLASLLAGKHELC